MPTFTRVDYDPFATQPGDTKGPKLERVDYDPFAGVQRPKVEAAKPSGALRRVVGDTLVDAARGVVALGEGAVGLANIPTLGYAGKGMEAIGYDPQRAHEMLSEGYSHERQKAEAEVQQAEGFIGTAKAMLERPSTIAGAVVQSIPSILGGGAIARGAGAALKGAKAQTLAAIPRSSSGKLVLAVGGEGAIMAGSQAEGIRQQTEDGLLTPGQSAIAVGTGVAGGALGVLGGKFANKLGIGDVDQLAAGITPTAAAGAPTKNFLRRGAEGAVVEGAFEELPQSVMETGLQNLALDRPLGEGVPEAAAAGLLTGAAVGGPIAAIQRPGAAPPPAPAPTAEEQPPVARPMLALPPPVVEVGPDGTASTPGQRDQAARADSNFAAFRESLGLTPDVNAARRQHPSAVPNVTVPDPSNGPLSRAVNMAAIEGALPQQKPVIEAGQAAVSAKEIRERQILRELHDKDRQRLKLIAEANGYDGDAILGLDDSEPGDLAGTEDRFLAAYVRALAERLPQPTDNGRDDAEETRIGLEVDRQTRDQLARALQAGIDPTNGKPIASEGIHRQYATELENLDIAIATAEEFLGAQAPTDKDAANVAAPETGEAGSAAVEPVGPPRGSTPDAAVAQGAVPPAATGAPPEPAAPVTPPQANSLPRVMRKADAIAHIQKHAGISKAEATATFEGIDRAGLKEGTRLGASVAAAAEAAKTRKAEQARTVAQPPLPAAQNVSHAQPGDAPAVVTAQAAEPAASTTNPDAPQRTKAQQAALDRIDRGSAYFATQSKAYDFIAQGGIAKTHEVIQTKPGRFEIRAKESDAVADNAGTTGTAPQSSDASAAPDSTEQADDDAANKALREAVAEKAQDKTDATAEAAPTIDTNIPDRSDPLFRQKNELRQLRNALAGDNSPRGVPWSADEKTRLSYERSVRELEAEIEQAEAPAKPTKSDKAEIRPYRRPDGTVGYEAIPIIEAAPPSANTIFTEDAAEAARARLKDKLGRLNTGIDPEMMLDGLTLAGYHIEKGARTFAAYADAMIADLGDAVRPYLKSWYMAAKYDPRFASFEGMSSPADVDAADVSQEAYTETTAPTEANDNEQRSRTDLESPEALGEVAPEESGRAKSERPVGSGDAGRRDGSNGGNAEANADGLSGTRSGRSRAPKADPAAPRAEGKRPRRGTRGTGEAGSPAPESSPQLDLVPQQGPNVPAIDFTITDDVGLGKGGEVQKFNDNLAAIRTLRTIEAEQRRATADEQRALARYVGWGGLANAFSDDAGNFKAGWEARGKELAALLTEKELSAARRSTRNAHYTSQTIVRGMWRALQRLGFRGGLVLEPSAGTGNFLGLAPEALRGDTRFIGVEYDSLTSRIAGALYPQATILHSGFQSVPLADNSMDAVIGNPPFGSESLRFQFKPELNGHSIHNQFFISGLDALKTDGLMSMVVSRYLLDRKGSDSRRMMAERAELVGAIRLPDSAFKENARTEVVTDILIFRKRSPEEMELVAEALRDPKKMTDELREQLAWIETTTVPDPTGADPIEVSRYFADNPSMILGSLERSGSMRFDNDITVRATGDIEQALAAAIDKLPVNIVSPSRDGIDTAIERYESMTEALKIAMEGREAGAIKADPDGRLRQVIERETPEGGYELATRTLSAESPWSEQLYMGADGKWFRLVEQLDDKGNKVKQTDAQGKPTRFNAYVREAFASDADVPASLRLGKTGFERLSALVGLRDLLKQQLIIEADDVPAAEMEANRKLLGAAYRAFVKAHGLVNIPANAKLLSGMPDGALVLALELKYRPATKDTKAKAEPAAILSSRVVVPYVPPSKAATPADALAISLAETGRVDMDRIAKLLGTDEAGAIAELHDAPADPLVFLDPEEKRWVSRNEYLSGQVKRKLAAAQTEGLPKNIAALEAVQPEQWGAENVTVTIGAGWVPERVYADFAEHITGGKASVRYSALTNSFSLSVQGGGRNEDYDITTAEGRVIMGAADLLDDLLNSRSTTIRTAPDSNGKTHIDQEATALAQLKRRAIANEFADWVFVESDRRNKLVELFNDKFNTRVNRQHDGTHLTLPGKVPDAIISMRRHQKNAIWRGISERFMLLDHVVGAGKTFTAIARAMERRRMGLARKPMIVVPNHMIEQFASDTFRLYPGAKVLAAGSKDFEKGRRRKLFAKIATGDWDLVIVPHSSFGFIGIAPETEERYLQAEIALAEQAIQDAQEQAEEDGHSGFRKPFNVKEAERLRETLENRLKGVRSTKHDRMLTFEQMGVDDLTIDEAHEFKNLFYSSRLTNVRGMGDKTGSRKAADLYNKVRVLTESPTGAVTFMTGTPISNSAVEMFTMMRYLAAGQLRELGIEHFDAWRSQFVDASTAFEPTETGGLKEVNRLGRTWSNMRSLMELYYGFADVVANEDIVRWYAEDNDGARFPIPNIKGGARRNIVIKPTRAQEAILEAVIQRFNALPSIKDPKDRNKERLRAMDVARKVALDARAAGGRATDNEAGGKLAKVSEEVARIYRAWQEDKGTQLVFLDRSVPKAKGDDKLIKEYDDLVARQQAAAAKGDEATYMELADQFDKFSANEIEELRAAQNGGWNAYQQIKDNLIASGIPADHVRFVQEANNDQQKKALFDAVNAGEVRVLIGSTPRMGAGTNVQERLVALHHVDVTWKPSDIEQREGRVIRQGNSLLTKHGESFEVEILAYSTERTIDAKMWDLNSQKLKTINGIRNYDGEFTMEFEDEDAVGMAEMAALASGDPRLMERVKLISEIDKLELLERAQRRKVYGLKSRLDDARKTLSTGDKSLARYDRIAKRLQAGIDAAKASAEGRKVTIEGNEYLNPRSASTALEAAIAEQKGADPRAKFSVTINGKRYTATDAAEAAVADAIGDGDLFEAVIGKDTLARRTSAAKAIGQIINGKGQQNDVTLGSLFGVRLVGDVQRANGEFVASLSLLDDDGSTLLSIDSKPITDDEFSTLALRSMLDYLYGGTVGNYAAHRAADIRRRVAQAKEDLPKLEAEVGKPWPFADELTAKRDRLEALVNELKADTGSKPDANAALLSRPTTAADGLNPSGKGRPQTVSEVRAAISEVTRDWKAGPLVQVVERAPAGMPADTEGWYDPETGAVGLVASNLRSPRHARTVLAHEVVGHYGIEKITGAKEWGEIAELVRKMASNPKHASLFVELEQRSYSRTSPEFVKEAVAVMAEKGVQNSIIDRVMAAVRRFLRGLGFRLGMSEAELRQHIVKAARAVAGAPTAPPKGGRMPEPALASKAPQVFYSAALTSIMQGKGAPKRGDAAAWKGWMDGAVRRGEFKQSERDWLGLDAWLDGQDNVTRDQLADFVRANQVQVQDVVLSDGSDATAAALPEGWTVSREVGEWQVLDEDGEVMGTGDSREAAIEDAQDPDAREDIASTKYSNYRIPGGENYRELLLTLPQVTTAEPARAEYESWAQRNGLSPNATMTEERYQRETGREAPPPRTMSAMSADAARNFRSSHWDQPNVLAHVRFDERTDADGRRVLFVQEIQSDWHQAGRKKGYGKASNFYLERPDGSIYSERFPRTTKDAAEAFLADVLADGFVPDGTRVIERKDGAFGVPNAPLKQADEWAMLAFKRMARWAVDNGFDRIAWVTGEQAADLFDLSKQVESIYAQRNADGTFNLAAETPGGEYPNLGESIAREKLSDYVGKDLAEKISGQPDGQHIYSGLDLKVGGEGMRGFYDKILPAAVSKWGKKFGAKVGQVAISSDERRGLPNASRVIRDSGDAEATTSAHSIDITPQMREAVAAGQPLFSQPTDSDGKTLARAFKALAKLDRVFQYPISNRTTLSGILGDILPKENISLVSREKARARFEPGGPILPAVRSVIQVGNSKAVVMEEVEGDRLFVNAADLEPGQSRGSALYMALFNYAHNTGKVFIGDPSGLSDAALLRRTELMAAAAIRYGGTWFMEPHPRQVKPDRDWATPLRWTDGDSEANLAALLEASYNNAKRFAPGIANVVFDFDRQEFLRAGREPAGRDEFERLAAGARAAFAGRPGQHDEAGEAAFGRTTIARAMFADSVLRAVRQGRPGVVDQLQGLGARQGGVAPRALREVLYSRPAHPAAAGTLPQSPDSRLSIKDKLKSKLTDLKPLLLGAIPMNYLVDYAHKGMKAVQQYIDFRYQMDTMRNKLHQEYDEAAQAWLTFNNKDKGAARRLADLMHESTIAGVDPAAEPDVYEDDADKKRIYRELRERFEELPTEGRRLYRVVRDGYSKQVRLLEQTLEENFKRAVEIRRAQAERDYMRRLDDITSDPSLSAAEKTQARAIAGSEFERAVKASARSMKGKIIALRQKFESMRVEAPYFPLKRFGRYSVAVKQRGELVSFSKFETSAEAIEFGNTMKAQGYDAHVWLDSEKAGDRTAIDPRFVADIDAILADMGGIKDDAAERFLRGDTVSTSEDAATSMVETMRDAIYQRYLDSLPDMSMRKSFMHRKKTAGYSNDALRAFSSTMFHGSYQIARLRYGMEMGEALELADEQARKHDPIEGMALVNELRKRHEWVMNPKGSVAAQVATSAAFIYHLGANPAHLFLNATQTVMLGVPILGSRYGFRKTSAALLRAARDFIAGKGHAENANISPDEKKAMQQFIDSGLIDKTQAHDLAGVGETGIEYSAMRHRIMSKIGWFFHQSERFNREVTALAAYRLAADSGDSHQAAVRQASDLTWQAHFDYSSGNRARYMQGDAAKVLLVFRNYNVNMLYRLFRDIHRSLRGESAQARNEARRQLGAMFGMYGLMAGVAGMPFYGLAMAIGGMLDDDDEPFAFEDRFKQGTAELLGEDVARYLLGGVPGATFNVDLSERIGMPNLWFRSPDRELEGRDAYFYWMEQLLGATPAIAKNLFGGLQQIHEGNIAKGTETIMPAAVRSVLRAGRYAATGEEVNNAGDHVANMDANDVIARALGFTPLSLVEQYDANSAVKGADAKLLKRRQQLIIRFAAARELGDSDGVEDALAAITAFSERNPAYRITRDTITRSLRMRARNDALNEGGIVMSKRLQALRAQQAED